MITTPQELAERLESEDMETEVVMVSGALVVDSEYQDDFINALTKLFEEYAYQEEYELEVEEV